MLSMLLYAIYHANIASDEKNREYPLALYVFTDDIELKDKSESPAE